MFKKGSALVPTFTAFAVTTLLEQHLAWLVDYEFTARRWKSSLDDIAIGERRLPEAYLTRSSTWATPACRASWSRQKATIDPRKVCTLPVGEMQRRRAPWTVRVGRYGPYLARRR